MLLATVTLLTVMPLPVAPTVAPAMKFVPVRVTFTAVPCMPLLGVTEVRVGVLCAAVTVKVSMLLVPPLVTTQVLCAPVATVEEMLYVAVICVGLTTTMLVWVSPLPCRWTCDAEVKFVPVRVTLTEVPRAPLDGVTDVRVGTPVTAFTVNGVVPLVPALVVTETVWVPTVADAPIVKVAVACVVLTTEAFDTVMPEPLVLMVSGETKPVPVRVTGTEEP